MRNLSTWLLVMFIVMFWIFRVIVAVTSELAIDFGGLKPMDMTTEVILLFVVLGCLIFIIRRKIVGAFIYLCSYGLYFGKGIYDCIMIISANGLTQGVALNLFVSVIGIILPLAVLIDLLVDRNRKTNPSDKKTDWYYKNEEYDRKMDERADKNNYRTM